VRIRERVAIQHGTEGKRAKVPKLRLPRVEQFRGARRDHRPCSVDCSSHVDGTDPDTHTEVPLGRVHVIAIRDVDVPNFGRHVVRIARGGSNEVEQRRIDVGRTCGRPQDNIHLPPLPTTVVENMHGRRLAH